MTEADDELKRMLQMTPQELDRHFASLPPDGTSTLLVADLEAKPASPERDKIISDAKAYWYDDFKTLNPSACPKITLVVDLRRAGFDDLASNAINGKYD